MKKKSAILGVLIFMALLLMMGCGKNAEELHRQTRAEKARLDSLDKAALKVGVMPTLDCMPIYVAKETHLFDTLGVDVHLKWYSAQMDCDTALLRGRVEGAVTDLVRASYMSHKKGLSLQYPIATVAYWQLLSNRKARVTELKQLSDKMIAITRHSATDMLADMAIDSVRPKYEVYRVQINDVRIRLKMLLNNEMDAMLLTEPQATQARLAGHPVLMDSRDKDLQLGVVAFRSKVLKDSRRQKQLALFLKAYDMAVDSLNARGLKHYAPILKKYCDTDDKTIAAIPRVRFQYAHSPRQKDLAKANGAVEKK